MAQQIFKTDYTKMRRWEAWLDWIVNKVTGLTICGGLVPYPIENIRQVADVRYLELSLYQRLFKLQLVNQLLSKNAN